MMWTRWVYDFYLLSFYILNDTIIKLKGPRELSVNPTLFTNIATHPLKPV